MPAAAHRVVLSGSERALLASICGLALPPAFEAEPPEPEQQLATGRALADRGMVIETASSDGPGFRPVDSIAANLRIFATATASVQIDILVAGRGLRAVYAVAGGLGAGLVTLAEGRAELSMFPAAAVGLELIRVVPPAAAGGSVRSVLDGDGDPALAGRLPLAALEATDAAFSEPPGSTAADRRLVNEVRATTNGSLRCLISGRGADGALSVGPVVWLATGRGWLGLRPAPDDTARRMVELVPVGREDIAAWAAPFLTQILTEGAA
jgi:hypothetical protein